MGTNCIFLYFSGENNSVAVCHVLAEHNYCAISEDISKRPVNGKLLIHMHNYDTYLLNTS